MSSWGQKLAFRWLAREETVATRQCVHFCGFRYSRGELNPYETYARALARNEPVAQARTAFVEFLQHYRPRHFGEALGLDLQRNYPLWLYPWTRRSVQPGWYDVPGDCPDVLTYFSELGISRRRIGLEFGWMENAFASIRQHGYQPARFRSVIRARKFLAEDGTAAYLILDGNHRLAVLAALGVERITLRHLPSATVRRSDLPRWPRVRDGTYLPEDASKVFAVYFTGNQRGSTQTPAARLIDDDR